MVVGDSCVQCCGLTSLNANLERNFYFDDRDQTPDLHQNDQKKDADLHADPIPGFTHVGNRGEQFTFIHRNVSLQPMFLPFQKWQRCHDLTYFGQHIEILSKRFKKINWITELDPGCIWIGMP